MQCIKYITQLYIINITKVVINVKLSIMALIIISLNNPFTATSVVQNNRVFILA